MAEMMASGGGDLSEENTNDYYGTGYGAGLNNNAQPRQRFPGLYVGNLTWWTTDQDVINAINSVGVNDVQEVKFFENRNNGQSKGFCVVTFGSETSLPIVMDKLPKLELHGQNPVVTPYNRQNLNLFESQTKSRPQINSSNGPTSQHAAGIMGINSISGVHAGAQAAAAATAMPYAGVNAYNQGGIVGGTVGGPRNSSYHSNMRMQMRAPRAMMRGTMPGAMNNGPMMPGGHQMNRMRFMQPQGWNNSQGAYNPAGARMPQVGMDMSNRLGGMGVKQDDTSIGQDMLSNAGSQNYYTPQHPGSQPDHYRSDIRDHRDLRDERDSSSRRMDDRPSRLDDRSLRHDDRPLRDDRSSKQDDRSERSRREDRSSRRDEERSRRDDRRDDRSSRREEKSSRREKSHRSDDRDRRSRSRSRDRSRDRKERRDRRERY